MQLPRDRFDFSPIVERPVVALPGNARLAVYLIVNVECWDFDRAVARKYFGAPQGTDFVPDVPNWSWHEYGMRVGIWRLLDSLARHGVPVAAAINAQVCTSEYEPVARALRDAQVEFMGHGVAQVPVGALPDPGASIRQAFDTLKAYTGVAPGGWLGPGLQETPETPDHLAAAGFRYVVDWALDEVPFLMKTATKPLAAMPYTLELSDLPMMVAHQHDSEVWLKRVIAQFDRLYEEGAIRPRVMSMSVHPYIIGVPHRIGYFERALDHILSKADVWFARPGEICDWFVGDPAGVGTRATER